ncbi:MAG: hypothetical protein M1819_001908 [Sarea resinae]|nr:MAG: hypothetical protein M1819_001908 [Sarea resinae]
MQCYTELTPPTAVTHALTLPFLAPSSNNLVVAKTSLLQIFRWKTIITEVDGTQDNHAAVDENPQVPSRRDLESENNEQTFLGTDLTIQRAERIHSTKLILVAEYSLPGTVTSLARIKTLNSKAGGEALLVAFRDAKLSLVEWDPERHSLSTISIHYYEGDDLLKSPWASDLSQYASYLSVDPSSRCAVLKFGARSLAVLPFHQAGDDLVMDDYDPDLDGENPEPKSSLKTVGGNTSSWPTPYASSFVLSLATVQPRLIHPLHLAFLYEYREPTFGVLSCEKSPSSSLLHERRDMLSYGVYTLELEQRQSTELLSISGLPYDLHRVIPLPLPVGGALLVGANELIHVDQAGKTNAVGVNEFAKQSSSFAMADQSDLQLKLEGCSIQQLGADNGDMAIILNTGELAILGFAMDGRSVSSVNVRRVTVDHGGKILQAGAFCTTLVDRGRILVGSEDADSVLLGWTQRSNRSAKQRQHMEMDDEDDLFDSADGEDQDDLYSGEAEQTQERKDASAALERSQAGDYVFRIHDILPNVAPTREIALGSPAFFPDSEQEKNSRDVVADLELVTPSGRGRAGGVAVMGRGIAPKVIGRFEFLEAQGVWSVCAKRPIAKGMVSQSSAKGKEGPEAAYALDIEYDRFMIVSKMSSTGADESAVYALTPTGFEELKGTEFEPSAGGTIDVGTLARGMRVVQVLGAEIRSYDGELGLSQIFPMADELTGAEPTVVSVSFADPYLLIVRDDASIVVLEADDSGDLDEVERGDALMSMKWLSGSLYRDRNGAIEMKSGREKSQGKVLMFLLNTQGGMQIYALPDLTKPIYVAEGLSYLPPMLSSDYTVRRSTTKETLTEVIVADLGDETASTPYMILRTANDDLTIYEPYHWRDGGSETSLSSSLHFLKIPNPHLPKSPAEAAHDDTEGNQGGRANPLRAVSNIGGYSTVFLPGSSPSFIIKSAQSIPKVLNLQGKAVRGMSGFHTGGCDRGFVYVDNNGIVRVSQLPPKTHFSETGWATRKVAVGSEVYTLSYHAPMGVYVIGTSEKEEFKLPEDDDFHHEWKREDTSFKPEIDHGFIKILNPITWTVVDTYELEPTESVICIKTLNLEISETTHERKPLIAVGTAILQGEDLSTKGNIYIFDIISVVPEPGHPETNRKLKLIAKEEVKGAVTALSEIGSQGFLLAAQGQKCMVRGLKEDGSLLPVAFMDMQCYVSVAKELKGTGLCIMGDALKGIWLTGYSEEPYKMNLFGKDVTHLSVMAADFLPDANQLFIIVADDNCNLHVLQFDPEHPQSLSGQRLIHRSAFHTGHFTTSINLLPSTLPRLSVTSPDDNDTSMTDSPTNHQDQDLATLPPHHLLITSQSGTLALLSPLTESQYRRLSALQTALLNSLEHACGLNPRAYRAVSALHAAGSAGTIGGGGGGGLGVGIGGGVNSGRNVVDGALLRQYMMLGSQRRAEICGRIGAEDWEVRADLDIVGGAGLGFL